MAQFNKKISRRTALKTMAAGGIGIMAAGSVISCKNGSSKSTESEPMVSKDGKVTSRHWDSTGDTISLLGLGCMRLPSKGSNNDLDQEQVNAMVDYCFEKGINYFDTAPVYGASEITMGVALSRYPRESYFLATKMSNMAFGGAVPTAEGARNMFETSLANLQTDYIDYYLLHGVNTVKEFNLRFIENGVIDYLFKLREEGKIRHIGFSFHGGNTDLEELVALPYKWEFVQIQMNYLDWKHMDGGFAGPSDSETLYNILERNNIPVVVMEPIRGGALASVNDGLQQMMKKARPELSPAGMALSFAASFPGVMAVLSGMSNMEQLVENANTFTDFKPLTDKDKEVLMDVARLYRANSTIGCTGCSYCMPCPFGVNIPANFKVYDSCASELNIPDPNGEHDKEYKAKRKIFLNRYNSEVKISERADVCTKCHTCEQKCPQHFRISEKLQMINDLVKALESE